VPWDDPVFVVGPLKVQEGLAQILDRGEILHPEEVFLEDADKARGHAVAFRGPDQGWGAFDTQKGKFFSSGAKAVVFPAPTCQPPEWW